MKAVILAAGRGSSLGTFTMEQPKCMLPIGEETILERQIRCLKECGMVYTDMILVVGYKKEAISVPEGIQIVINDFYGNTNNSYSLSLALRGIEEDVAVIDGDLIFEKDVLQELLVCGENTLLAVDKDTDYGMTGIRINAKGSVLEIGKHLQAAVTYASMMKICKDSLDVFKEELGHVKYKKSWYTLPLAKILHEAAFQVRFAKSPVYEINTCTDYFEAKRKLGIENHSILVTGASGFLGKKVYYTLKRNYSVYGVHRHKSDEGEFYAVDLTDPEAVMAYFSLTKPAIVIHTAGIAEPETCEKDRELAEKVNVKAVENLISACRKWDVKLIHISTDYVFDGEKETVYRKEDIRNPKNYYGQTKVQAEDLVKEYKNSLIVRIPILYGYNDEKDKETFPVKVIRNVREGLEFYADNQQVRYPVLIDEVAIQLANSLHRQGILHISSGRGVTKYEWARILAQEFGYDKDLVKERNGSLTDRPQHVQLEIAEGDARVSDVAAGTKILRKQMSCAFKLIYKSHAYKNVYGKNVGEYRYRLGKSLGKSIPLAIREELDYVVPVPSSGLYYAMGMAEEINVPYLEALTKPDAAVRSFQLADLGLREKVIQDKLYPIPELLNGKNVALVDEAIFTGVTLRVVCDMVRACGAGKIYLCIPTPFCRKECRQYVQPERKLLFQEIGDRSMEEYFKVDGVVFQEYGSFIQSLKDVSHVCYECFG